MKKDICSVPAIPDNDFLLHLPDPVLFSPLFSRYSLFLHLVHTGTASCNFYKTQHHELQFLQQLQPLPPISQPRQLFPFLFASSDPLSDLENLPVPVALNAVLLILFLSPLLHPQFSQPHYHPATKLFHRIPDKTSYRLP